MIDGFQLRDIMQKSLFTLTPDVEINRAMRLLLDRQLSGAPVLDAEGTIVGVLSQKDCLKAALNAHYHQAWGGTVQEYMTPDVVTLEADMDLLAVANHFIHSSYRRFPVLERGKLVGQLSRSDLLLALSEHWN